MKKKTSGAIGSGRISEVKKNEWEKRRGMKKKGVKRGKENVRQKRSKRGLFKEDVRVVFQRKPFKFLVKGEIWRVVVIFLGKTLWRSLRTGLIVNLIRVRVCVWRLV